MSFERCRAPKILVALAGLSLVLGGCGRPRANGDADGDPVLIRVTLERAYVRSFQGADRVGVIGAGTHTVGGPSRVGLGMGIGFSSTEVELWLGTRPGAADLVRMPLRWGQTERTLPLRPGRVIFTTLSVRGGYSGRERIPERTLPQPSPVVLELVCDRDGARWLDLTPTPVPAPAEPVAEPQPEPEAEPQPEPKAEQQAE